MSTQMAAAAEEQVQTTEAMSQQIDRIAQLSASTANEAQLGMELTKKLELFSEELHSLAWSALIVKSLFHVNKRGS